MVLPDRLPTDPENLCRPRVSEGSSARPDGAPSAQFGQREPAAAEPDLRRETYTGSKSPAPPAARGEGSPSVRLSSIRRNCCSMH